MYKIDDQISLAEFMSPFGNLDPNNRWATIADLVPWQQYEKKYAQQFCANNGTPAIKFRMAMGTLLIKQQTGHSDEETLQNIKENPYMQYLIGLHEFTTVAPFSASSITNFRKYITAEMINEINDFLFRTVHTDNDNPPPPPNSPDNEPPNLTQSPKKGTLIHDATCAPADIAYPTDINLLNEAREKLETIIDEMQPHNDREKPRTYRKRARKEYLRFILNKKPGHGKVRKAIKQQLGYVARDIRHIDDMLTRIPIKHLSNPHQGWLQTIRKLYEQQLFMYETQTHSVPDRIVSIGQPHIRPIVRGKAKAPVEFGAKISISLTNGFSFIDRLSWNAYNEDADLITAIEKYKTFNGVYPERVLTDQLYHTRTNRKYCKERGIRLSAKPMGPTPKGMEKAIEKQQIRDAADRSPVEGKFGEGKNKYGLNRIMARIKESSETVISLAFLCMNLNLKLRIFLCFFQISLFLLKKPKFVTHNPWRNIPSCSSVFYLGVAG